MIPPQPGVPEGEPLLLTPPDPTPEPRENGSCHTAYINIGRLQEGGDSVETEDDQGYLELGSLWALSTIPTLLNAKLLLPPLSLPPLTPESP